MEIRKESFNEVYVELLKKLRTEGEVSVNRKGDKITELHDQKFIIDSPIQCFAFCRDFSLDYLRKEFEFYMSGSDKLEDAIKCSAFWSKCSDDGKTINSNYGKLLFYDKNSRGKTQFQHAVDCLLNSRDSKKAVMTIYGPENAYISNDNPCTMFLQARITQEDKLNLSVFMRSSDIYYGLPYDVPFFVFVQTALIEELIRHGYEKLNYGTYTHIAGSLHKYERNEEALIVAEQNNERPLGYERKVFAEYARLLASGLDTVAELHSNIVAKKFMDRAWNVAANAKCLKKKVGACLTTIKDGVEVEVCSFEGGRDGKPCIKCVRDINKANPMADRYYGDECPSVHAEMKCITQAMRSGLTSFKNATIYVTHGPCDACLKFCNHVGITKVYYDMPYKTDYKHWSKISVIKL